MTAPGHDHTKMHTQTRRNACTTALRNYMMSPVEGADAINVSTPSMPCAMSDRTTMTADGIDDDQVTVAMMDVARNAHEPPPGAHTTTPHDKAR